jgi:hypothetical protein
MKTKITYIKDKKPTLKELQKMVGGYIQIVETKGKQIIMDEEGKLKDKPLNEEATELWGVDYDVIVGDAVVLSNKALLD